MIKTYTNYIKALDNMKKYPKELYTLGDVTLLERPKVSIVGTRKPSIYTQDQTKTLASALAKRGVCLVSGAAMGVDALVHQGAGLNNTIAVVANSLDIRYPSINRHMIEGIEKEGLVISQFPVSTKAAPWSFVVRNELVVALGDILIVTEADVNSGSMRSVEFALKMGKEIYVLAQRLGESNATNQLLEDGLAQPIYNIETFANKYGIVPTSEVVSKDDFFYFCQTSPTFDDAVAQFNDRVYEAELEGLIYIENGLVRLV
ncbi:MAG: Rossmann fold nucleotide-binding protein Smf possibly involved in DNA uptake [uncultured Sulfurovum sp.]|uniref:Rossmann fold nucleotide-binding protein Smf possibly involved in DNA uptake n=1 Tax=uncultured Sulfurovum sp. TaxID=269237 RepID=A0A6S6U471_9BACT|nr:MAG: Rossmann fold nucleotide-binding protein Smf possibly involved in DNA uptake [uncultured Sulfurovum sp.]